MTLEECKNEIKELKERLEKLEAEKIEKPQQLKRWKPEYNERYNIIDDNGETCDLRWDDDRYDNWRYLIGNCFKTEEEAEEYKKKIEYTARYKNYIEEHSEPIDWEDKEQEKYYPTFDSSQIEYQYSRFYKQQGIIYASSEQILEDAIKEIGEDNFKKYVLEVE